VTRKCLSLMTQLCCYRPLSGCKIARLEGTIQTQFRPLTVIYFSLNKMLIVKSK